jgi:hypothetical protein
LTFAPEWFFSWRAIHRSITDTAWKLVCEYWTET